LGDAYIVKAQDAIVRAMIEWRGRHGCKSGKGFYDYPEERGLKQLWLGLSDIAPTKVTEVSEQDVFNLQQRLLIRQPCTQIWPAVYTVRLAAADG
jgi:3-hydroxyacyl-CoA dehydrogenase / enoyl-CoA hydratase / 3-hydroxybutyryl-CoA epimerase